MAFPLLQRNPRPDTIGLLYGAIVAQARHPVFYGEYDIPDTVEGRFDMIVLHVALFFRRVRADAEPIRDLGQGCSIGFALTSRTIFANWASAISGCRKKCGDVARRSMAALRPMKGHLLIQTTFRSSRHWP